MSNETQFTMETLKNIKNGVVAFKAAWCGPCKSYSPVLETMKQNGYDVHVLDVDDNEEISMQLRVRGVPTTFVVKDGEIVNTLSGSQSENQLKEVLA
jgi:thioredoxin-like negative regulator of GroEL